MDDLRVLRAADRRAVPWRNGGGATRVLMTVPTPPSAAGAWAGAGFDWRISLADVAQEGPFSAFPGVDRIITVVDGAGMELTVAGRRHRLAGRFRPFAFSGDADTACRLLGGPLVALNLMTRRGRVNGRVEMVRDKTVRLAAGAGEDRVLVLLEGTATAVLPPGALRLGRLDAVHRAGGADGAAGPAPEISVTGTAAVITIAVTERRCDS